MTIFGVDLYFATPTTLPVAASTLSALLESTAIWRIVVDLVLIGLAGGLYIVPLYALVQRRTPMNVMSRVIAATSIWNAIFMVVASLFGALMVHNGVSVPGLLLCCALLNIVVTAVIYAQVPEFLLRFLAWVLTRLIYRVRVTGTDHIPRKGPALVICNHVSYVDALVLSSAVVRPMRFVMEAAIFRFPLLNWIFTGMKAIPVSSARENRAVREAAFEAVAEALRDGHVVCIFPEGKLTRDGDIDEFRPGILRILAENPVPIVPIGLSGLWGSLFSYGARGLARFLPVRFKSRVEMRIGAAVTPTGVTPDGLRHTVLALRGSRR